MKTTDDVIRQMYQTTRIISVSLNEILEPYGLFSSEWAIITVIKEKGLMSQISLANYLNIEPPAISKSLMSLERKGIVRRQEGVDKREKMVTLSEEALRSYPLWEEAVARHREKTLAGLTDNNLRELYGTLRSIFLNSQKMRTPKI